MTKLERLIEELCPNGVEYKKFGEIATISRGASPRPIKSFLTDNTQGVHWIKIGDVKTGAKYIESTEEFITTEGAKKSRAVKKGDFILSNSMSFGRPYILRIDGCIHDGWLSISNFEHSILSDFLYYVLNSTQIQAEMRKRASFGGAVQNLNADIVRELMLPVPPLEVQDEIVKILDNFTELTTELTTELATELTARKKQYEYYRYVLLSDTSDNDFEVLSVGEVSKFRRGSFPQPYGNKEWYDGEGAMPFVQVADIGDDMRLVEDTKRKISKVAQPKSVFAPKGSIIISLQGSIGRIAVTQYDAYIDRTVAIFSDISDRLIPKYFVYQLQRIFTVKEKTARGSTIKTITKEEFTSFPIMVPPIEKQRRIVDILDRFDKLCNDISDGLPAEIEARQKQYEYYRDKLLTFKELKK